ncbi:MAG: ABC transporter permease [Eggerthellaceae bacterium]|nr:ABC transporter permease [Eggerthellaceae bacterium]
MKNAGYVARQIARRLATGIAMLFVVSIIVFFCTQALPGDIARQVLGQNATPEQLANLRVQLGLDRPILVQYAQWLWGMLQLDPGVSLASRTPVASLIASRLTNSLTIVGIAFVFVVVLGYGLGILACRKPGGIVDTVVSGIDHFILSLPEFVVGIIVITLLAVGALRLFPPASIIDSRYPAWQQPELLVLPVLCLVLVATPHVLESIRTLLREELESPAVVWARLSGIGEGRILMRYALPNILAPSLQVVAASVNFLLGGMVAVETVFAFPGIGSALVSAVSTRDIVTVQAIAMFIAVVMVVALMVADIIGDMSMARVRTKEDGQ